MHELVGFVGRIVAEPRLFRIRAVEDADAVDERAGGFHRLRGRYGPVRNVLVEILVIGRHAVREEDDDLLRVLPGSFHCLLRGFHALVGRGRANRAQSGHRRFQAAGITGQILHDTGILSEPRYGDLYLVAIVGNGRIDGRGGVDETVDRGFQGFHAPRIRRTAGIPLVSVHAEIHRSGGIQYQHDVEFGGGLMRFAGAFADHVEVQRVFAVFVVDDSFRMFRRRDSRV